MSSHEKEVAKEFSEKKILKKEDRISIPTVKYFWQASPLSSKKKDNIPRFLRSLNVFTGFSDYELKQFSHFLHERVFSDNELIIEEGGSGFGFYIIYNGQVDIFTKRKKHLEDGGTENYQQHITILSKYEYFGELSLMESQNKRNASAIAKGPATLLAIYRPDVEELIERYPLLGAKFLQGISFIVAQRFNRIAAEVRSQREKIKDLEAKLESTEV